MSAVICRKPRQKGGSIADILINSGYLPELHYRGFDTGFKKYNFAGPGTDLDKRLNPDKTWKDWSEPVNRVDMTAYYHDLAYQQHQDHESRKTADNIMITGLDNVLYDRDARWTERLDAGIVGTVMKTKRFLGLGKKKKTKKSAKPRPKAKKSKTKKRK